VVRAVEPGWRAFDVTRGPGRLASVDDVEERP
jgi:hypothetical protein